MLSDPEHRGAVMKILCDMGLHKAIPSKIWNDGYYFSRCVRCGADMIRAPEGPWKTVPSTLRVVWRKRTQDDVVWPTHIL